MKLYDKNQKYQEVLFKIAEKAIMVSLDEIKSLDDDCVMCWLLMGWVNCISETSLIEVKKLYKVIRELQSKIVKNNCNVIDQFLHQVHINSLGQKLFFD